MRKFLFAIAITQIPLFTTAQEQIEELNLSIYNPMMINPAQTGADIKHRAFVQGRLETNGPTYGKALTSYDTYFDKIRSGFGIFSYQEEYSNYKFHKLGLNYSFRIKITEKQNLRFGVGLIWNRNEFDFSNLYYEEHDPLIIPAKVVYNYFHLNTGIYYSYSNFSIGIAAFNLTDAKYNVPFASYPFYTPRYFTLYVGYKIKIGRAIEYNPQILDYVEGNQGYSYTQISLYNKFTFANRVFISPNVYLYSDPRNLFGIYEPAYGIGVQAGVKFAKYFELTVSVLQYQFTQLGYYSYKPFKNFEAMLRFKI